MDFSTWLNKKYVEFRGGSRATVSDFAKFIDVPQSVISKWMGRKEEKPGRKNLTKLANKLGPEVYDVLGMPRPIDNLPIDPHIVRIASLISELPEDRRPFARQKIIDSAENIVKDEKARYNPK